MRVTRPLIRLPFWTFVAANLFGVSHPCLAAAASATGHLEVSADIVRSRALYREAQSAFENGQYLLAQQKLLQAWAIRKTFDVAASLTQVELELKQYRNAAEHAEYCLRVFAPAESEATLRSVLEMYAEAKKHIATLRIHAKPDGAQVVTDGQNVGTAPLVSPLFLEPGEHAIEVRLANTTDVRRVHLDAGKEYDINLELQPATTVIPNPSTGATPTSIVAQDQSPPTERASTRNFAPVYWTLGIGGTVTIAGLVTGLMYHMRANTKEDSAATIRARTPTCSNVSSDDCARLASVTAERNQANDNAQIILGLTGAAAIGAALVTYLVWPASTFSGSVQTGTWITPNSAGLGLSTQF